MSNNDDEKSFTDIKENNNFNNGEDGRQISDKFKEHNKNVTSFVD